MRSPIAARAAKPLGAGTVAPVRTAVRVAPPPTGDRAGKLPIGAAGPNRVMSGLSRTAAMSCAIPAIIRAITCATSPGPAGTSGRTGPYAGPSRTVPLPAHRGRP